MDGTGLYYYGARYYDPGIGRFISADSLVPDRSDPQAFNRYSYVVNNPLRYTDPSGSYFVPVNGTDAQLEWFWNELYNLKEVDAYRGSLDTWGLSDNRIELNLAECGPGTDLYTSIISKVPRDQGGLKGGSNLAKLEAVADVVGFVSPLGDAASVLINVTQGDLEGTSLSCLAFLPIGDVAKLAKYADEVGDAGKVVTYSRKIENDMARRGWTKAEVQSTIDEALHVSPATNKATGGNATAYFRADGSYVVRDNTTGSIIQVSNRNNPNWAPDNTIVDPYIPQR